MTIFCVPGLVFGIIGVCQKNRSKVMSIIGMILNILFVLGGMWLHILHGLMRDKHVTFDIPGLVQGDE